VPAQAYTTLVGLHADDQVAILVHPLPELRMLPSPLHPAIVHFPIVFTILLPFVALGALWAIRRGVSSRRAWAVPLLGAILLSLSAWVAVQTGEADEDRAEDIAGEQVMHAHEEAAERFLLLSGGVVVLMTAGLLRGTPGKAGRLLASTAALFLVVAGYNVGHSGGKVVFGDSVNPGISALGGNPAAEGQEGMDSDRQHDED
jgi:uncharacterized membrane protein